MNAIDKVNVEINYERPHIDFPDLSGEHGNPYHFWPLMLRALRTHGYHKEANDLPNYMQLKYEEMFDLLAHFLDFAERQEIIHEEDEYITVRIKKSESLLKSTKQLPLFKEQNKDNIEMLYLKGIDLTVQNCYGRNILYYADNPALLNYLLTLNEQESLFNLFELDNLNTTILYGHADNFVNFTKLLDKMVQFNPELTKLLLFSNNDVNQSPLNKYLAHLDATFCKKGMKEINPTHWEDFCHSLKVIKKVDAVLHQDIVSMVNQIPLIEQALKNTQSETYKLYAHFLLDQKLEDKQPKSVVNKI